MKISNSNFEQVLPFKRGTHTTMACNNQSIFDTLTPFVVLRISPKVKELQQSVGWAIACHALDYKPIKQMK